MSHELHVSATGQASMAFVGTTPWHKLGQRVTEGAPLETWTKEAGFDWQAIAAPVEYRDSTGAYHTADSKKVLYRSDTGAALSVMGDGYKIVQPAEVLEFFRDLTESGNWHIHTAGVLHGGRKLWAMARNSTEAEVMPGDRVRGNLLLATSLDGSMATSAGMTTIRVVCANTLGAAMSTDGHGFSRTSHKSVFDSQSVKDSILGARESFAEFMVRARKLAESPVHVDQAREILRGLIGQPARIAQPETVTVSSGSSEFSRLMYGSNRVDAKLREHRNVTRILELFGGAARGSDHPSSRGTAWGLLNSVTEFVDHEAGRSADTRLDSAWFGRGAELKQNAMTTIAQAVNA